MVKKYFNWLSGGAPLMLLPLFLRVWFIIGTKFGVLNVILYH